MKAKALICDEKQNFSIEEVNLKDITPDEILIKTSYSGVSIGTEFALIRGKISGGPYPLCTGYMGTGIVEALGAKVDKFKVGDKIYVRKNMGLETLADGTKIAAVSGVHCSHIVTSGDPNHTHGAGHLYPGVSMEVASMFVMPAVGLFGVDMSNPKMGQTVVVYGAGLIGLGVIAACVHRGCIVIAVDINKKQLELAREMGADYLIDGSSQDVKEEVIKIAPEGAAVVFECTGIPACIDPAIDLCRRYGSFIWQGLYGRKPITMHFLPPHHRRLTMHFPCDDGLIPCRRAVIKNMAMGALKWDKLITHRVTSKDAPDIFSRINDGDKDIIGVVINWQNS